MGSYFAVQQCINARPDPGDFLKELEEFKEGKTEELDALRGLVNRRTRQWPRSWAVYSLLISFISVAGLVCGLFVLCMF